ncbi:MAG TPA: tetratricopeptide repeat protein [Candidatus Polarisedimenticolia bacterium]|nr:tetratricopeptide repeat protein [Candidatus Polarisedimenticolia bacterium]
MRPVRAVVLAAAFAAAAVAWPAPSWATQDKDVYARGRDAVFAERWAEAREAFQELLREHPDSGYADDAHYWLGMTLYELGKAEEAYTVLKEMNGRFPESPWSDDGRVLMVRCAEAVIKGAPRGAPRSGSSFGLGAEPVRLAEYEAFIERSTRDTSSKVQLLAIDSMLESRPEKAGELIPRLSTGRAPRQAAGMVLDRFFGGETVKVAVEDPRLGMSEGNVAVMIRRGEQVTHLGLSEALEAARPGPAGPHRFDEATSEQIRRKLVQAERNLVRSGDPGSIESAPGADGASMSAIVKVVDGEIHYYRTGAETSRIVVLRREAGFNGANVRVFVEAGGTMREIPLQEARGLVAGATGEGSPLSEATVRYLKAALAIIEIDLTRAAGGNPERG